MAYILKYIFNVSRDAYENDKDPRIEHLPLVHSIMPVFSIIGVYLVCVLYLGPKWMAHRRPYDLKYIMRFYNAIQVLANASLLIYGVRHSLLQKDFSLTCQPIDSNNKERWMVHLVYATYGYYLTKYLDLFDTVFFILRKKYNQITFLHVYHHGGMIFAVYVHTKYLAGSHPTMLGVINLLVHTVMYSYYFITSLKPSAATVWWKRHITQLQLAQFGYLIIHFAMVLANNHCNFPRLVTFVGFIQNMFMFTMFFDFYYKTYMRQPAMSAAKLLAKQGESTALSGGGDNNKCN